MISGLLGKKIGMTQIFREDGVRVPVTVLEVGPCVVQAVKTVETDGYNAVQIGFADTKENRLNKPQREYLKSNKLPAKKFVREIRMDDVSEFKVGDEITNSVFQKGDYLDITGVTKGKGFQGGVKRHGWAGGKATHGSKNHRVPGSIGASSYPSRVFKGQSMPGHMGNEKITVQNIEVVDVDTEKNLLVVKGAVPGANSAYLTVRFSLKKPVAPRIEPAENETEAENKEGSEE